jgi:hypothetical protein
MAGIFISYRRSDSAGYAGRLVDDLAQQFDRDALFRDIEAIEPGVDFVDALEKAVALCSVMLVMIGPNWARASTADGQRRLHQPGDVVRMEIEAALARDIRVIPVLVGDAPMPSAADLPDSMAGLLRRHAYEISDQRWQYDVTRLLEILLRVPGVAALRSQPPPPPVMAQATTAGDRLAMGKRTPTRARAVAWLIGTLAISALLATGIVFLGRDGGAGERMEIGSSPVQTEIGSDESARLGTNVETGEAFLGRWIAGDGSHYLIDRSDEGIYVATGSSLAAGIGFDEATPAPDRPGMELFGDAVISGNRLSAELLDAYDGDVTTIDLMLSDDGRSLDGLIRNGDQSEFELVLTRR